MSAIGWRRSCKRARPLRPRQEGMVVTVESLQIEDEASALSPTKPIAEENSEKKSSALLPLVLSPGHSMKNMKSLTGGGSRGLRFLLSCRVFARGNATKVFVGGLSYDTNETVLRDAFQQYGDIIEVKVICDHVSGKSKGYGFVNFDAETAAAEALKEMDGQLLDGRNIRVQYAQKQNERHK